MWFTTEKKQKVVGVLGVVEIGMQGPHLWTKPGHSFVTKKWQLQKGAF